MYILHRTRFWFWCGKVGFRSLWFLVKKLFLVVSDIFGRQLLGQFGVLEELRMVTFLENSATSGR